MNNTHTLIEKLIDLDKILQRKLWVGWPESWLQINLPLGSARALLAIESGFANTPKALAELLKIGRTTVTGVLDRLEAEELITRSIDPQDRRSFILQLTPKGRELIQQLDEIRHKQLSRALTLLDNDSLESLTKGMEALAEALKNTWL